jgi:UPF0489 domain
MRMSAEASAEAKKYERIRVVVVESHQKVLPHVHGRLRQQRRRRRAHRNRAAADRPHVEGWELVHFDSHADLACPGNLPAKRCWRPYPDEPNDGGDHDDDSSRSSNSSNGAQIMSLYEHLESTPSGIAEWILPLVLGAGCTNVTWIRPPPSFPTSVGDLHQAHSVHNASFPLGRHSFSVGAWMPAFAAVNHVEAAATPPTPSSFLDLPIEARIRVDSHSPYYADDEEGEEEAEGIVRRNFADDAGGTADVDIKLPGCFAPAHELLFAQPVRLAVSYGDCEDDGLSEDRHAASSMPQGSPESHATSSPSAPQPGIGDCGNDDVVDEKDWILDVCLDYFWCDNPFWHDLWQMHAGFATALSWLVCQSDLYDGGLNGLSTSSSSLIPCQFAAHSARPSAMDAHFYERRRRVLRFRRVLGEYLRETAAAAGAPTAGPCVPAEQEASSAALSRFQGSLMPFYLDSLALEAREAMQEVEATLAAIPDADDRAALVREGVQAIPYLTLPRDKGDPQQVVEARLVRFSEFLNRSSSISSSALQPTNRRRRRAPRPLLITVARSAQDGFLPIHLVDDIQGKVLDVLHDQYCACKSRRFGKVGGHEVSDSNMQRCDETNQMNRGSYRQESIGAIEDSRPECSMEIVIDYDHFDGDD